MYQVMSTDEYEGYPKSATPRRAVWGGFKQNTTAHGVPHINNARGPVKTVFWSLVLVACLCGLGFNLYLLANFFFSYSVNVKIQMKHQTELTFPAVTVCNQNPVRKKAIEENDNLNQIVYGVEQNDNNNQAKRRRKRAGPPPATTTPSATTDNSTVDSTEGTTEDNAVTPSSGPQGPQATSNGPPGPQATNNPGGPAVTEDPTGNTEGASDSEYGNGGGQGFESSGVKRKDGRSQRQSFQLMLKVQRVMADLSLDEKRPLGHQMDEFIADCYYGGYECYVNETSFSSFYNEMFGNCFTFNSGWGGQELEVSFKAGPQYGLQLIFNIDQDEYVGNLAEAAGVRVVIHPQDRMPFPEDEGVSISPAMMTNIGVKMLEIERKGGLYGNCTPGSDLPTSWKQNVFSEHYPVSYSAQSCYKTCYQAEVIDRCTCFDSQYPGYGLAFDYVNVTACDITNTSAVACMDGVTDDYRTGVLTCSCPMPCREVTYTTEISSVLWPSSDYKNSLFEALASKDEKIKRVLNNPEEPEKYKENLAKLVVYYQEFNYESIYEVAAYKPGEFVSDIGGILGLFIGFSVMTIVEFFELGADIIVVSLAAAFGRSNVNSRRLSPESNTEDVTGNKQGATGSTTTLHGRPSKTPPPPYSMHTSSDIRLKEMPGVSNT